MSDKLTLLRAVVAAKQVYWDAMNALEAALVPVGDITDRQVNTIFEHVEALAYNPPAAVTPEALAELTADLRLLAKAPYVALTREQFEKMYTDQLKLTGTTWNELDVAASWRSYSADPAGHWLSKVTS